ncbi:hypothetical protein [Nostoc sp.]|uniref:hypothetical protein n=1 Tax=Nostoc sp. TaxID=1180 RepID=UPI002FF6AC39
MSENLLIDLCEPYLLDLIRLLSECMRRFEEKTLDIAEEGGYDFTDAVLKQIDGLDNVQKAEILAAAANQVLMTSRRDAGVRPASDRSTPNS